MRKARSVLFPLLLSTVIGCAEEPVALQCVEPSEAVTFLILLDEQGQQATLEADLPGWGEVGRLLVTETEYQISVPIPSAEGFENRFWIDRVTGEGQVNTLQQDGDAVLGGTFFTLRCERFDLDSRL